MKKVFKLILIISILLTLVACDRTMNDNISPNEPDVSSSISKPEAIPSVDSAPENGLSDEPEQIENGDDNTTDNIIAADDLTPTPSPSVAPMDALEPTAVPTTKPPSILTEPTPTTPAFEIEPMLTTAHEPRITNISVTVGSSVFSIILYDNDAAKAFSSLLPMTLNMSELNGNEKYYYMPEKFPTYSQRVGNINAGELMLYGSDCLVMFYESFNTSYSYTKLGYIENVSGLVDVLGRGSVQVTFATCE